MNKVIFGILLFLGLSAQAKYFSAPVNEVKLKDISVTTDSEEQKSLLEILQTKRTLIFVPAYFSCESTCSLLSENLRDAIGNSKTRQDIDVVFLSFNSRDDKNQMKMFRTHHNLPGHWILAVSKNESQVRDLLGDFGYRIRRTSGGYDHPNSAFILSSVNRIWTGMLVGVNNTPVDIENALAEAADIDKNGSPKKFFRYLTKIEYIIIGGFLGMVIPLLIIVFLLLRRMKKANWNAETKAAQ